MSTVTNLHKAKVEKNDEFYTQYNDIQKELNAYLEYNSDAFKDKVILLPCDDPEWSNFTKFFAQNFEMLGLKKLISTSYAINSKPKNESPYVSLFELEDEKYDPVKSRDCGKIFTLTKEENTQVDINNLKWDYLEGDGDFRSEEVKKLRDEADIIVTNPPFSLFREFLKWILDANKQFLIIGSMNAAGDKEIFPLIQNNKIWIGCSEVKTFTRPDNTIKTFGNIFWFTNIEHGRRHQPLALMTYQDNLHFSRHKEIKINGYSTYDNYDAIEVPCIDAIPNDYIGLMGVPITFLRKYCPEQFEIVGSTQRGCHDNIPDTSNYSDYLEYKQDGTCTGATGNKIGEGAVLVKNDGLHNYFKNSEGREIQALYTRILIKKK